jgi:putative transposase
VTRHWSGKHHAVVEGINLTTLLWTDGVSSLPWDCRLYEPAEAGKTQVTKNDHFLAMLQTAKERQFRPRYVCFDGWYSSLANLKAVREYGWHLLTRLKSNRQVNLDNKENGAVKDIDIPAHGREVHLKGFGFIQVFRTVAANGDVEHEKIEYWATDDLKMEDGERSELVGQVFAIENYHRQLKQCCLKQCCGIEKAQVRSAKAQKRHILLSLRAFVRLEAHRLLTGISGYAAKANLIREAIRLYLRQPNITLGATA